MELFARRLKERAAQLGISDREAARRCDLEERRYAHYANGRSEPNLTTLVIIARSLGTTVDWLLGLETPLDTSPKRAEQLQRLLHAAQDMSAAELRQTVVQAEAVSRDL